LYNVPKERAIKQPHSIGTGDTAMNGIIVKTHVSARASEDEGYIDTPSSIELTRDHWVFINTNTGISLGIERYVLDALLRWE
jgi:hypothetical protein